MNFAAAPVVSSAPRGTTFIRMATALATGGSYLEAAEHARSRHGENAPPTRLLRSVAAAGGVAPADWGAELVADYATAAAEFLALVTQKSVVGQLTGLVKVPLETRIVVATSGGTAAWLGQFLPIVVSRLGFLTEPLARLKLASLIVLSTELAKSSSAVSEAMLLAILAATVSARLDQSFLDPTNGGVVDVEPASVLFGAAPVAATGTASGDIAALVEGFAGDLSRAYLIGSPVRLAGMAGVALPDVGPRGGSAMGLPTIASAAAGDNLILLDPGLIAYASDLIVLDTSTNASIQMADDPASGATVEASLWQNNLTALKAVQFANWRGAPGCAAYVAGA